MTMLTDNEKSALTLIAGIKEKRAEQQRLLQQLERQLAVKAEYGIEAHEISSIRLIPRGYDTTVGFARVKDHERGYQQLPLLYGSVVTMKDGSEVKLPDVNIKQLLDGE